MDAGREERLQQTAFRTRGETAGLDLEEQRDRRRSAVNLPASLGRRGYVCSQEGPAEARAGLKHQGRVERKMCIVHW